MYFIASTSILLPYLLSALYQFKLVITNELKDAKVKNGSLALIASIYSVWLIYAAGLKNLLLVSIVYGIGIIVYMFARKEKRESLFCRYREICDVGNCCRSYHITLSVDNWNDKNVKSPFHLKGFFLCVENI
ncbi:hypothetical protein ACUIJ5_04415 [Bacillus toyonensis]